MICQQCGYCCKHLWVIIVDDPDKGIVDGNLIPHNGQGQPCQHLIEDEPNKCSCVVHDRKWYKKTPCFDYGQIEGSPKTPCRMGVYILERSRNEKLQPLMGKD